jgi:hypothetical protein
MSVCSLPTVYSASCWACVAICAWCILQLTVCSGSCRACAVPICAWCNLQLSGEPPAGHVPICACMVARTLLSAPHMLSNLPMSIYLLCLLSGMCSNLCMVCFATVCSASCRACVPICAWCSCGDAAPTLGVGTNQNEHNHALLHTPSPLSWRWALAAVQHQHTTVPQAALCMHDAFSCVQQ